MRLEDAVGRVRVVTLSRAARRGRVVGIFQGFVVVYLDRPLRVRQHRMGTEMIDRLRKIDSGELDPEHD